MTPIPVQSVKPSVDPKNDKVELLKIGSAIFFPAAKTTAVMNAPVLVRSLDGTRCRMIQSEYMMTCLTAPKRFLKLKGQNL
jgi:hypothetical protein